MNLLSFHNQNVLFFRPRALHDVGIELVVPSFADLLPRSVGQERGYQDPALISMLCDKLSDLLVLLSFQKGISHTSL